mmetsp:Transcript_28437/g.66023  ORF Transcript_28437/g.66023 Transcript_28437/m.66023 type:complete len:111 (-) Transcript_28437:53-385(-)
MDEHDFNALFAALDVDHNEKVDFLEFCTFLSSCGVEFETALEQRRRYSHGLRQPGRRRSSAPTAAQFEEAARRVSEASQRDIEDVQGGLDSGAAGRPVDENITPIAEEEK